MLIDADFTSRFWAKVDSSEDDLCWPWQGGKTVRGYGTVRTRRPRSMTTAHRVAWILTHGDIEDGIDVCHTCDNPSCCNPGHLFLGTRQDNMDDAKLKGRTNNGR